MKQHLPMSRLSTKDIILLCTLETLFDLEIWDCSHRRYVESMVYKGSKIEVEIPECCFVLFYFIVHLFIVGLHLGMWIKVGPTRELFSLLLLNYHIRNEITNAI